VLHKFETGSVAASARLRVETNVLRPAEQLYDANELATATIEEAVNYFADEGQPSEHC